MFAEPFRENQPEKCERIPCYQVLLNFTNRILAGGKQGE